MAVERFSNFPSYYCLNILFLKFLRVYSHPTDEKLIFQNIIKRLSRDSFNNVFSIYINFRIKSKITCLRELSSFHLNQHFVWTLTPTDYLEPFRTVNVYYFRREMSHLLIILFYFFQHHYYLIIPFSLLKKFNLRRRLTPPSREPASNPNHNNI